MGSLCCEASLVLAWSLAVATLAPGCNSPNADAVEVRGDAEVVAEVTDATREVASKVGSEVASEVGSEVGAEADAETDVAAEAETSGRETTPGMRQTVTGECSWSVAFSAAAKAQGRKDCTYTRHYTGRETTSEPWIYPQADVTFRADVELSGALCYAQIGSSKATQEWLGFGGGHFYRAANLPNESGTLVTTDDSYTVDGVYPQCDYTLTVHGTFQRGMEPGDAGNGLATPTTYACGWPHADPPAFSGSEDLAKGATLPDGLFEDKCGEYARLHDFAGGYFVVEFAAADCEPCQSLAEGERAFVTRMASDGIPVRVITLVRPELHAACVVGDTTTLTDWLDYFQLTEPVFLDRCYSGALQFNHGMPGVLWPDGIEHLPTTIAVGKDLKILSLDHGADFGAAESAIRANAGK